MIFEAAGRAAHENSNLRGCICTWACVHMRSTCTCASKRTLRSVAVFPRAQSAHVLKLVQRSICICTYTYAYVRAVRLHAIATHARAATASSLSDPGALGSPRVRHRQRWRRSANLLHLCLGMPSRHRAADRQHRSLDKGPGPSPTHRLSTASSGANGTPTSTAHDQQAHVNMFATAERLYIL